MNAEREFRYSARAQSGELVRGAVSAASIDDVVRMLRGRALLATDVYAAAERPLARLRFGWGSPRRVTIVGFYRALAIMMRSGVPVRRALAVSIDRANDRRFDETLRAVLADIEAGASLSAAFAKRPQTFAPLAVAMIRAGEMGGVLDVILERLATLAERDRSTERRIRGALAYPGFILATALLVVVLAIVKLLPSFAPIYAALNVPLPPETQALLAASRIVEDPFVLAIAATALGFAALAGIVALRRPSAQDALDVARLRLAVLGPLVRKNIASRIARTLGTLLRSGVGVLQALDVVEPIAGSRTYATHLAKVRTAVSDGAPLGDAMRACGGFDALFCAMVGVGEETGAVDEMLLTLADYYDDDVAFAIASLSSILEPALLVVLGLVVGVLVYVIFIPMYSLIGGIK
jgi:type IV pilus assembly protein PilC